MCVCVCVCVCVYFEHDLNITLSSPPGKLECSAPE